MGKKRIVIVGAGVSGLTAGIYALKYGFDVEVVERNMCVGGLCVGWQRKGTYIDGCIHWLTESDKGVLSEVWREIGALSDETDVYHYDIYSEAKLGDKSVMFYTDPDKLLAELLSHAESEQDREWMKKYVKAVKVCRHNAITVHKPYHKWNLIDVFKLIRKIFPVMPTMKKYAKLSIKEFVDQLQSKTLKHAFTHSLVPDDFSLFSLMSTFAGMAWRNSGTPIGGSKAFAERIKDKYLSLGGKLTLRADVEEIVVEDNIAKGIKLADGTMIEADYVIPACDVHHTLDNLLKGKYRIPELDMRDKDKEHNPTYSMMLVSYRTKKDLTGVVHNRYVKCDSYDVLGYPVEVVYVKHFGYDKTLSKNGETVVQAIVNTNEDMFNKLEAMTPEVYKAYKAELAKLLEQKIYEADGDLYGELELLDVATPLTFTHYCNSYKGTFMTYMLTKNNKQMRLFNNCLPIKNLAVAGHWMMVPGGIPIAAMQGKFAAMTIADIDKQKR